MRVWCLTLFFFCAVSVDCLGNDLEESYPYSFVHAPFVSPSLIQELVDPYPSCYRNLCHSVEVWSTASHIPEVCESSKIEQPCEGSRPVFFSYSYVGKTDSGIHVLKTSDCGGGTGVFMGLLLVTFERDPFLEDGVLGERISIKKVGCLYLGDRWIGQLEVKGNRLSILTEGDLMGNKPPEPLLEVFDLEYHIPSLFSFEEKEEPLAPLQLAIWKKDETQLKEILESGEVQIPDAGLFDLIESYGGAKCALLLIEYGANIAATDEKGNTPLHYAVKEGNLELIGHLLERGVDVNPTNDEGYTPLELALEEGCLNEDHIDLMLLFGARIPLNGKMLLRAALCHKHDLVQYLLDQGVDVNWEDEYGDTTLLKVLKWAENTEMAKFLIERGADCQRALPNSIELKDLEFIEILLERGADITGTGASETPLYLATECGWIEGVNFLLNNGACVNQPDEYSHKTPLHVAAERGSLPLVKLLLERGADVKAHSKWGYTPFSLAVASEHKEVILYLIAHGALD